MMLGKVEARRSYRQLSPTKGTLTICSGSFVLCTRVDCCQRNSKPDGVLSPNNIGFALTDALRCISSVYNDSAVVDDHLIIDGGVIGCDQNQVGSVQRVHIQGNG